MTERPRLVVIRNFALGFFSCYLMGAVPMGVLIARMDKPVVAVVWSALTWPAILARVSQAVIRHEH